MPDRRREPRQAGERHRCGGRVLLAAGRDRAARLGQAVPPNNTEDPSLNVDTTRNGVEPDIAFTGTSDTVPWVVWYEKGTSASPHGLHNNEMVFAARGLTPGFPAPTGTVEGGFDWTAVGNGGQGILDHTAVTGGTCAAEPTSEAACSLNKNAGSNAEDPRVAAGTMTAGQPTVPWVSWDENVGGRQQVFVSHLVGSGAAAHFEIVNGGAPISTGENSSTRPDIAFSGNTPFVSWREDVGGGIEKAFTGHFVNPAAPTFVLDGNEVPLTPSAQADVRVPISSSCTETPFNADGSACQGGALGTPFFLFTNGTTPRSLFADAFQPDAPVTEDASAVDSSSGILHAAVDLHGAPANVVFQYGTTTAYGTTAGAQTLAASGTPAPFSTALSGLAAGTTIHYRAVASSDFGTFFGNDKTLITTAVPPVLKPGPPAIVIGRATASKPTVSGTGVKVRVSCSGPVSATCRVTLDLTVTETFHGHRLVAVRAAGTARTTHRRLVVGSTSVVLLAGHAKVLRIVLNRAGKRLLSKRHGLKATLRVTAATAGAKPASILTRVVTFKAAR